MRTIKTSLDEMVAATSREIQEEVAMEFALSNRLYELMQKRGLSTVELAQALGKRPAVITKWLSGQHDFSIKTLVLLSTFFGEALVTVG